MRAAFGTTAGYEHRVVPWDEVGEEEGTGIVHIAPGCGAEDFQLGKALGLPVIAPIDEYGIVLDGFGSLTGRDVRDVAEPIVEDLKSEGRLFRLEPYRTATRTAGGAARRCSSGSSTSGTSHGPGLRPAARDPHAEQVDAACATIMEVVDRIRWIPDFGHERELDWLRNMGDWMISQEALLGLALPI